MMPPPFFTARGLSKRTDDLNGLKSDIDQDISKIEAAIAGIEAITELVEQAKGLAITAKATGDTSLAVQFDALLLQIDALANDSTYAGTNLLQVAPDNLAVNFNEDDSNNLTISGIDASTGTGGINVVGAVGNFAANTNIDEAITAFNSAISTLRTHAATLGSNETVLQTRINFTEDLVNILEECSGKLTLADLNEVSTNLLALQTRQQLGINSLSLAAQSERSILALFC